MSKNYDYYGNEIPKKPRKPWINTAIYVSAGLVVAGSIAGLTTWLILSNRNDYGFVDKNIGPAITYKFDSQDPSTDLDGNFEFEVVEYKTQYIVEGTDDRSYAPNDYFLGKEGIDLLIKKMKSSLVFGPEIMNLKRIYINNSNMTSPGENGIYYPATNEIGINTNNLAQKLNTKMVDFPDETFLTFPTTLQFRVEVVFQTLVHEYGHHIAHSYMNSSFGNYTGNDLNDNIPDIFTTYEDGNRRRDNWNAEFVSDFMDALDYDEDTHPMVDSTDLNGTVSVGSIYDGETLFNLANGHDNPQFTSQAMAFADITAYKNGNTIFKSLPKVSNDSLDYLYSMQELVTRKYLQLFYKENPTTIEMRRSGIGSANLENEIYYETPFRDPKTDEDPSNDKEVQQPPKRYMEDNIFDEEEKIGERKPEEILYDTFKKQIGFGKNVSFIWGNNNYYVIDGNRLTDDSSNRSNIDKIRIGGYIDSQNANDAVEIGYYNQDGTFSRIDNVKTFAFNMSRKNKIDSEVWAINDRTQNMYSWSTQTPIDGKIYMGKELVLRDSHNNDIPLSTARNDNGNVASNYISQFPTMGHQNGEENIHGPFYAVKEENGKVLIEQRSR